MTIKTESVAVDSCPQSRRSELETWFQEEFSFTGRTYSPPEWYVMASSGVELVGRLGVVERAISVGEREVRVAGVGGVTTRPKWRRQGVAQELLAATERLFRRLQVPFGFLLCRDNVRSVYERAGWNVVAARTRFDQPDSPETYPHLTMVLECGDERWPDGDVDLRGLPW